MENDNRKSDRLLKALSYVLVAVIASCLTFLVCLVTIGRTSKLEQLEKLIQQCFIGQADTTAMEDAAAAAMVDSLGDQWSYYVPASEYDALLDQLGNSYVGIGITIEEEEETGGLLVVQLSPGGGAETAGIQVGDIVIGVEGQSISEIGSTAATNLIRGEEGTSVSVAVLRDGTELTFQVVRRLIEVPVAQGKMLEGNVGYVRIANFDERCAQETIAAVDALVEQGAVALIFDVRFNPGGYTTEMVEVLDYLLPEGPLFRTVDYLGNDETQYSDAECIQLPMAVLINEYSISAAEFFAAALNEYDRAMLVGEPTTGKGYFQSLFPLNDGSAVGLSIGKYFTPNGVSLADAKGLTPEVIVEVDEETFARIYAGDLEPEEDPQLQKALAVLKNEKDAAS